MRLEHVTDDLGKPVGMPVTNFEPARLPLRTGSYAGLYCRLEPLAPRHASDLWECFSDDEQGKVWTYLHAGPFTDEHGFSAWIGQLCTLEVLYLYAIIDSSTERAVGFASYLRVDPNASSIEVGWVTFSPRLQRSRIATDAMFVMMREAFAMGYRRYEWKCNALNAPSIAAAHRLGFSFDGVFRNALVVKDRNRDTAWFSVIDRDWPALESAFRQWLAPENFDESSRQRSRLSDLTSAYVESRWPVLHIEL